MAICAGILAGGIVVFFFPIKFHPPPQVIPQSPPRIERLGVGSIDRFIASHRHDSDYIKPVIFRLYRVGCSPGHGFVFVQNQSYSVGIADAVLSNDYFDLGWGESHG